MSAALLTPGQLLTIGGPVEYSWSTIDPRLEGDEYLGCGVNTGALNILAAAVTTAKAENPANKRPPLISQLCAYEFPSRGWRWFYAPVRVASMLSVISRKNRTSRWCTLQLGCDGRSQVAVLRWMGIHVVTRPLESVSLKAGDAPLCEYELLGRAAVGADAFALTREGEAAPLSAILPPPEACGQYRRDQIYSALIRRVDTARREEEWLSSRERLSEPVAPEQPELPF
jgi:hypothetical protein